MEPNKKTPEIAEQIMGYLDTYIKLARYKAIDKFTNLFAALVTSAFVIVCGMLAFLFASVTLALYLSSITGSFWEGFGLVTLIYLFLALLVYLLKDRFISPAIINIVIRNIFKTKK